MNDNEKIDIATCCRRETPTEHEHRELFSHMVVSHVFMTLPCIYWLFYNFAITTDEQILDKFMAIIMTSSVLMSIIYHYYYERILCNIECNWSIYSTIFLNIYMFMKNVDNLAIAQGWLILIVLSKYLDFSFSADNNCYETHHPFCHYIAGLYVAHCVYNLQNSVCFDTEVLPKPIG